MKRIPVLLLVLLLSASLLVGCGVNEKIGQKVGEKVAESLAEKALGGNADIDIKDGGLVIKDKDGQSLTIGSSKWPDVDYVPEFKGGTILTSTVDGNGNMSVMLEDVDANDFQDYLARIKQDFPLEPFEAQTETSIHYQGQNSKGEHVAVQYNGDNGTLIVMAERKAN